MSLQVIGAGFGRTATLSLKFALEQLGVGRCYHMMETLDNPRSHEAWERAGRGHAVDWDDIFQGYAATVDWPACRFYKELAAHYPSAKVILTVRDANQWFDSTQESIFKELETFVSDGTTAWARMVKSIVVDAFDGRLHDRAHCIAVYEQHNEAVRHTIPANRLLVFESDQRWEPLCGFLGLPTPAAPYPKLNNPQDYQRDAGSRLNALTGRV